MKNKILIKITLLFSLFSTFSVFGQLEVAITMDDVPNKTFFISSDKYSTLKTLDSLNIPICIFINEGKIFKEDSITKKKLLTDWISRRYITLGNHSYSHYRYSEVGFDIFSEDIKRGEIVTSELAKKNNKELKYFRLPYNDLGIDSLQHKNISNFLEINNYQITPFTIESMDWMYNYVYEYYLSKNEVDMANKIGLEYVNKTIEYFNYIENITQQKYGRKIRQIYMCHDNVLNSRYLPRIVVELKHKKYKFISLKKALKDKVYNQEDKYYKKWGISWIYRWINDQKERSNLLKNEPNTEEIENLYNSILKENKSQ